MPVILSLVPTWVALLALAAQAMRAEGKLLHRPNGGSNAVGQGLAAQGCAGQPADLSPQLLDPLQHGIMALRPQPACRMDQGHLGLPDRLLGLCLDVEEILLGGLDRPDEPGLLVHEDQGRAQVDAGRALGLVGGIDVEAQAGMAMAPLDADDAVLVQHRQMALHLAVGAADMARQGGVGDAQHRPAGPAAARQQLQQDLQRLADGMAQRPAPGRIPKDHAGPIDRGHGLGEALVVDGPLGGAFLACLAFGGEDAGPGGVGRRMELVFRSHHPVRTFAGAFLSS